MDGCLWISPGVLPSEGRSSSTQDFARLISGWCPTLVTGLEVWTQNLTEPYSIETEVAAVHDAVTRRGWGTYHLAGFSAGATVALAAAREDPSSVRTLTLLEPATIGDDDWSPQETSWRRDLDLVRRQPLELRPHALRSLFMQQGLDPPTHAPDPPPWTIRTDRLEDMLAHVGFESADLAGLGQPTLVISGDRSNARFRLLAQRVVDVAPQARSITYGGCSHLDPPHRAAPHLLAADLSAFWKLPTAG